jgi:hypothetical protein
MFYICCAFDVGASFALNETVCSGISTFFHHTIGNCLVLAKGAPTETFIHEPPLYPIPVRMAQPGGIHEKPRRGIFLRLFFLFTLARPQAGVNPLPHFRRFTCLWQAPAGTQNRTLRCPISKCESPNAPAKTSPGKPGSQIRTLPI